MEPSQNPYAPPQAVVADTPEIDDRGSKPKEAVVAVSLIWTSLALGAVHAAIIWGFLTSTSSVGMVLAIQIFSFLLVAWLAVKISAGRNWARITYLVLFLIGTPAFVMGELQEFARAPIPGTLGLIQFGLQVGAIVLVFGPGRRWFRRARRA